MYSQLQLRYEPARQLSITSLSPSPLVNSLPVHIILMWLALLPLEMESLLTGLLSKTNSPGLIRELTLEMYVYLP